MYSKAITGINLLIFLLSLSQVQAQESGKHHQFRFLEIKGHSGNHYYSGNTLTDELESGYRAIEVRYGWQSNNPDSWQSLFRYPSYGFGWYNGFVGNPKVLGIPAGLYGFISFPLFQFKRNEIVLEPALGLSYDLKPYDPDKNSENDAIGSRVNVYFNLNLGGRYRLTREVDLLYGWDITHFSNGRTFEPNAGLNMIGPNIGIRYNFNALQNKVDNSANPTKILEARPELSYYRKARPVRQGNFLLYLATGLVQTEKDKGSDKQYSTFSSTFEYQYVFTEKNGATIGLDAFYDNSLKESHPTETYDFYGAHLGYDLMFWQLTIRFQTGTYLTRKGLDLKGNYFFRPALKFDATRHLFFQLGLKTKNGFIADWIEYGLGLRLN